MATGLYELEIQHLKPFKRQIKTCPKCGFRVWRIPALFINWFDLPWTRFTVGFCIGGKPPEQTISMDSPIGEIRQSINMICAGVSDPHLHVRCTHCGYQCLMETMDASR